MRKIILLTLMFLFTSYFLGCSSNKDPDISGKYKFDKVIYLSPLSSARKDYLEKSMKGTVYKIKKDSFEIISSKDHYKISEPVYKKEKMDDDLIQKFDKSVYGLISISEYKEKYRYSIYDKYDYKILNYLYSMDDELWISSYVDNTANHSEITMRIFKLK